MCKSSKLFRTVLSLILAAVLTACAAAPAFAATAELASTQNFLDYLDSRSVKYSLDGMESNAETVRVTFTLDNFTSLRCSLFFKNDNEQVSLRIWDIITSSASKNYTLSVLNSLNYNYKWAKFVFDESDNTVQAEMDMYIDTDHCGRAVYDAMMVLFTVIDNDEVSEKLHSLE